MNPRIFLVIAGIATNGCMIVAPGATLHQLHRILPISTEVTPTDVAALKPGSQVLIRCETPNTLKEFQGTVLPASPNGVALMNCIKSGRMETRTSKVLRVPYVNRLFKNTGVGRESIPVQWVSIREMTSASEISSPPPDYVAPQLDINTNDEPFFERIDVDFDFNATR